MRFSTVSRLVKYCVALALLLGSAAGCYRYTPIRSDSLPPGENVRLYVTRSALLDLEEIVPVTGASVRGRIVRQEGGQVFVRVPSGTRQMGFHSEVFDQEVPIPVSEITQAERREFNRLGTGAFIAGAAGATAVVLFVILEAYGDAEPPEECPDCADMRVPLLTIPFR
jgi:hypothetical protein